MDARVGLAFLLLLHFSSWVGEGRNSFAPERSTDTYDLSVMQLHYQKQETKIQALEKVDRVGSVCSFCEEIATDILDWLNEDSTQTEIEDILLDICSILPSKYKTECTTLVETYAPIVILELKVITAEEVCAAIKLCDTSVTVFGAVQQDRCGKCQRAIAELLKELNDPDGQIKIIMLLMKACNSMEGHVKECKKMVLIYGHLFIANLENYLEKRDICTAAHVCALPKFESKQASSTLSETKTAVLAIS